MPDHDFKILDWKPMQRGSLCGFARVQMPSGLIVCDVTVFTGDRGPWAAPPAKPMIGRDGTTLRDEAGKTRYSPIIEFADRASRDRFSAAVLVALETAHPGAAS